MCGNTLFSGKRLIPYKEVVGKAKEWSEKKMKGINSFHLLRLLKEVIGL